MLSDSKKSELKKLFFFDPDRVDSLIEQSKDDPVLELALQDPAASILSANLICLRESIDAYIKNRIQTDKVLEGILRDIQGNIAEMAEFGTRLGIDKRLN
ncbi:MAG: hypothetical protein WAV28_07030 [Sedimentisphaerales bacterium]